MPGETVVSPSPIGAARVIDFWHSLAGTEYSAVLQKPSPFAVTGTGPFTPYSGTDLAGVALAQGADGLFIREVLLNGVWQRWLHLHGSVLYRPRYACVTARPGAQFRSVLGRAVWEAVVQWDAAPAAGVDSGIGFYTNDHDRARAGSLALPGMYVGNVAGVLTFVSRGPGGYEEVDVSANANPLANGNKVGLMLRRATANSDATVTVLVNDSAALVRRYAGAHKLPEHKNTTGAWYPCQVHAEAATYLRTQELHFYAGPDVENL